MEKKWFLIVTQNTSNTLMAQKILRAKMIEAIFVPAPPETGTVCAIAVKISEDDLEKSKKLLKAYKVQVTHLVEEKKLKLQGLIDKKMGLAVSDEFTRILNKIEEGEELSLADIVYCLSTSNGRESKMIYNIADKIRKEIVGDVVEVRGSIEFSNHCIKRCSYCGINADNRSISRYSMTEDEIMERVNAIHQTGMKTVILQSGEDLGWSLDRMTSLLRRIKEETGMRITLSNGEHTREEYEALKEAGADNYLLKIETTNRELFEKMHPDDDYDQRLQCSRWLKELGYLNASGNIIGLPGQTIEDIGQDILYFKEMGINMIGIGPFVPAHGSKFGNLPPGDIELTLRAMAVTRLVCKKVYIPTTTALATLDPDAPVRALQSGANAFMLVFTPEKYRGNYRIYDNKDLADLDSAMKAIKKADRVLPAYLKG